MDTVPKLIEAIATARSAYLGNIANITERQAHWKPNPETWSIVEITEHLFWAEHGGIVGMWKTLHGLREGSIARTDESPHKDMPIEKVISLTWSPKEKVPAVAAPRLGGPISFWKCSLNSLQEVLNKFGEDLQGDELRLQAHPHPISGPLDFQQRIEFLRFHLNRHQDQASHLVEIITS